MPKLGQPHELGGEHEGPEGVFVAVAPLAFELGGGGGAGFDAALGLEDGFGGVGVEVIGPGDGFGFARRAWGAGDAGEAGAEAGAEGLREAGRLGGGGLAGEDAQVEAAHKVLR